MTLEDAERAIRLQEYCMNEVGYDEETQQTVYVSAPDSSGNVTIIGADISGTSYHYSAIYIGDEEGLKSFLREYMVLEFYILYTQFHNALQNKGATLWRSI